MSRIIRDISTDIKCKIKEADRDIRKAIEKVSSYPSLAVKLYSFSVERLEEVDELHEEVVKEIEMYRKNNGEPPQQMLSLWDWEHESIMKDVTEIKLLQEYFNTL